MAQSLAQLMAQMQLAGTANNAPFTRDNLYDYESALKYGMQPNPVDQHWSSRVGTGPQEGLILKSESHPTMWMTLESEAAGGYNLFRNALDGRLYSFPKGSAIPDGYYPYEDTQIY